MVKQNINLPEKQLADFCRRDDFGPDSDLDVLVTFAPEASRSLFDHLQMEQELAALFNREIDLFSKRALNKATTGCAAKKY